MLENSIDRQFKLITQLPKTKTIGVGVLSIDRNGEAHFFENFGNMNDRLLATLTRARVEFIGKAGIMLEGMEPSGSDRQGRIKFNFQEWWLIFTAKEEVV